MFSSACRRGPLSLSAGSREQLPPTDNLAAWFRKGLGVTSSGGAVSGWADQTALGGRDYAQGTGASQPALQAGGTILFDGTNDFLRSPVIVLVQPYTRYIRMKQVTWTDADSVFDGIGANTGLLQQQAATPSLRLVAGTGAAPNTALSLGAWGSVAAVFNGASSVLNINGTETTGNPGTANPGGLTLGTDGGAVPTAFANVEVAEEIVYTVAHTAAQRAQVIAYLNTL